MKLSRQTSVGVWNDKLASNKPEYTFETRAPFSLCLYTGWFKKKKKKKRSTVSLITKKKNSKTGGKNCMELKVVEKKTSSFVSSSCIYLSLNRSKRFRCCERSTQLAVETRTSTEETTGWPCIRVAINNTNHDRRIQKSARKPTGYRQRLFFEERNQGIPCTHRPWFLFNQSFSCSENKRKRRKKRKDISNHCIGRI